MDTFSPPAHLYCEASGHPLPAPATHIYGPECEAETGKLMYLCQAHADQIALWAMAHAHDPVMCPTHGDIGPVKGYLILKKLPKGSS